MTFFYILGFFAQNTHLYIFTGHYSFPPCSRVLLAKPAGSQLVTKFPAFYGTRRSINDLQASATCPYPEPDRSVPYSQSYFLKIRLNINLLIKLYSVFMENCLGNSVVQYRVMR